MTTLVRPVTIRLASARARWPMRGVATSRWWLRFCRAVSRLLRRRTSNVTLVSTRLRQLLGTNYRDFTDRMQVETPIEKDGDTIVMRGCMAHSCTIEEAILVIDLNDGTPYVALKFNSKFRPIFAADRSLIPQSLRRAMRQE